MLAALAVLAVVNGVVWIGLWRGWTPRVCISAGALTLFILMGGALMWGQAASGVPVWQVWQKEFNTSLTASMSVYRQLGVEEAELQRSARWIKVVFVDAAIGWAVLGGLGLVFVFFLIQRQVNRHLPGSKIGLKPFVLWKVPDYFIWPVLLTMVFLWWGRAWGPQYFLTGLNAAVVLGNLYFLGGLAILLFHLERRQISKFFQFLIIAMVGLFPTMIGLLMMLGIINTWWDWRKIQPNQSPQ